MTRTIAGRFHKGFLQTSSGTGYFEEEIDLSKLTIPKNPVAVFAAPSAVTVLRQDLRVGYQTGPDLISSLSNTRNGLYTDWPACVRSDLLN